MGRGQDNTYSKNSCRTCALKEVLILIRSPCYNRRAEKLKSNSRILDSDFAQLCIFARYKKEWQA